MTAEAFHDKSWITFQGTFAGISAGHSPVGEQENGFDGLLTQLGLGRGTRVTLYDARVSRVPEGLRFERVTCPAKDGRMAPFAVGVLTITDNDHPDVYETRKAQALRRVHDPRKMSHDPALPGFISTWDDRNLAVVATSPTEIDQLETLYQAFLRLDVLVCIRWQRGPTVHCPTFTIASAVPAVELDWAADRLTRAEHVRQRLKASGLEVQLAEAGRGYYRLDAHEVEGSGELVFWLNPWNTMLYKTGYFSLKDLQEWAADRGPAIRNATLEADEAGLGGHQGLLQLRSDLETLGGIRCYLAPRAIWLDEAETESGLRLYPFAEDAGKLPGTDLTWESAQALISALRGKQELPVAV